MSRTLVRTDRQTRTDPTARRDNPLVVPNGSFLPSLLFPFVSSSSPSLRAIHSFPHPIPPSPSHYHLSPTIPHSSFHSCIQKKSDLLLILGLHLSHSPSSSSSLTRYSPASHRVASYDPLLFLYKKRRPKENKASTSAAATTTVE